MHVEDELSRVDSLDESLKLSIVRVRGVGDLEVEGQVLIVLVVPAGQNDEYGREFSIALIDAKVKHVNQLIKCGTYS